MESDNLWKMVSCEDGIMYVGRFKVDNLIKSRYHRDMVLNTSLKAIEHGDIPCSIPDTIDSRIREDVKSIVAAYYITHPEKTPIEWEKRDYCGQIDKSGRVCTGSQPCTKSHA